MQNGSAHPCLNDIVALLSTVFGESIVQAKKNEILQTSHTESEQIAALLDSFAMLSPHTISHIKGHLSISKDVSQSDIQEMKADTPTHDDMISMSSDYLPQPASSEWLESISGRSINEQTIQFNPNF